MTGTGRVTPGLHGVPPGADFPAALVDGLLQRFDGAPPEALARVTLYLNTARMQRRVTELLAAGPARLLPRIRLVTELDTLPGAGLPPPVPPLRRALELARLTSALIKAEPDLAPEAAAFDLAASLAALMDEMQGEGVPLAALETLEVADLSGHWDRSLRFLRLVGGYLEPDPAAPTDPEARRRRVVALLAARWAADPPVDPVIVAGSTGSRGTTRAFMQAVMALPQGAVVLPGLDPHLPAAIWRTMTAERGPEDHPQYRFAALAEALGTEPSAIPPWHAPAAAGTPARGRLVSLALRPAPVTDSWRRDGPALGDLAVATSGLDLIEARGPREEAAALALRMRAALEDGHRVALITPDRALGRRVTAALDRWGLLPDDSAGVPLRQTAAGRLARLVAQLFARPLTAEALIALLNHPLVNAGDGRAGHLMATRALDLELRRNGPPFPDPTSLMSWAAGTKVAGTGTDLASWADWVAASAGGLGGPEWRQAPLARHVAELRHRIARLVGGPGGHEDLDVLCGTDSVPDREAARLLGELAREAEHAGPATAADFRAVLDSVLSGAIRDPAKPDGRVMIWGTLEARVQGADLVLLAGLNDGVWPELPAPDPWLNRPLRRAAGLLSPERSVGLAAHDFEQAIGAPRAVLSRARRDGDAETVPSRWLNRLTNLLAGLPDQNGAVALQAMRARGDAWLARAPMLDAPARSVPAAHRPAPRPPVPHRPRKLPVTALEDLIRDPYAVYARRILRLRPLEALRQRADARHRGMALHAVLERAVPVLAEHPPEQWPTLLQDIAETTLARTVPWAVERRLWLAHLGRIAPGFLAAEAARQAGGRPIAGELTGTWTLPEPPVTLTARVDRIDARDGGGVALYDYKSGAPPSEKQQAHFSKQLIFTALIAARGGFASLGPVRVVEAAYLGLGRSLEERRARLPDDPAETETGLAELLRRYADPAQGYPAQTAPETEGRRGDYHHLARVGEWRLSDRPVPEDVGG